MQLGVYIQGGLGDYLIQLNVLRLYIEQLRVMHVNEPVFVQFLIEESADPSFLESISFIDNVSVKHKHHPQFTNMQDSELYVEDTAAQFDILLVLKYVGRVYAKGALSHLNSADNPTWLTQWQPHFNNHPACCLELSRIGHFKEVLAKSLGLLLSTIDMQLPITIRPQDFEVAFQLPHPYIVIGAGTDPQLQSPVLTKSIPRDLLREVILDLLMLGYNVVEIGASDVSPVDVPGIISLIGLTTLAEVVPVLAGADSCLLVEGGLAHLSACIDKKAVVLFGPTDPDFLAYPIHHNLVTSQDCHPCYFTTSDWYLFCPKNKGAICMHDFSSSDIVKALLL